MAKQNTVFKDAFNRCLELFAETTTLPSEPELGQALGVSRTTVRAILARCEELSLIAWDKRSKTVLRRPEPSDYFPTAETDSLAERIERSFMRRFWQAAPSPACRSTSSSLPAKSVPGRPACANS